MSICPLQGQSAMRNRANRPKPGRKPCAERPHGHGGQTAPKRGLCAVFAGERRDHLPNNARVPAGVAGGGGACIVSGAGLGMVPGVAGRGCCRACCWCVCPAGGCAVAWVVPGAVVAPVSAWVHALCAFRRARRGCFCAKFRRKTWPSALAGCRCRRAVAVLVLSLRSPKIACRSTAGRWQVGLPKLPRGLPRLWAVVPAAKKPASVAAPVSFAVVIGCNPVRWLLSAVILCGVSVRGCRVFPPGRAWVPGAGGRKYARKGA